MLFWTNGLLVLVTRNNLAISGGSFWTYGDSR